MDKLQKQNEELLTWQKKPKEFSERLGEYLKGLQNVYRTDLPEEELVIWRETLKDYSLQELVAAVSNIVKHPPRYELDDGSIQTWYGMPKLADVIHVMLENRKEAARKKHEQEIKAQEAELKKLEQRRLEHPEEFFGWADLIEEFKKMHPKSKIVPDRDGKPTFGRIWPKEPRELTEAEYQDRIEILRQQAGKLKSEISDKTK